MSAVNPDHLISIPDTHMAEGDMQLLQVTLCLHTPTVERAHSNTYTLKKKKKCVIIKKKSLLGNTLEINPSLKEERKSSGWTLMLTIPRKVLDHSQRAQKSDGLFFFSSVVLG